MKILSCPPGTKLIDGLMSSKWAQSDDPYFKSRDEAIKFCQKLLEKQLIVGGQKIEMQKTKKEEEDDDEDEDAKKVRMCLSTLDLYCML